MLDTSLRYTLDRTTREVLFLPLPIDLTQRAKPFVDVTVDRVVKGLGAALLLLLIKPWGLGLSWQQLSYANLVIVAAWVGLALAARREYLDTFRRNLHARAVTPAAVRLDFADARTIDLLGRLHGACGRDDDGEIGSACPAPRRSFARRSGRCRK